MKNKRILFCAAVIAVAVAALCSGAFAQAGKKVRFVIIMLDEMAGSQFAKTFEDVATVVGKQTGWDTNLQIIPYSRGEKTYGIAKGIFANKKADYAEVFAEDYVRLVKKDDKKPLMRPLAILTMNKKKYAEVCYFVKADSPFKTVGDLKGKAIGASNAGYIRYPLHKFANYNDSLFKFFSKVKYQPDTNITDLIMGVSKGEYDTFATSLAGYKMASKPPEAANLKPIDCVEYSGNMMIVSDYNIPLEEAGVVRKLFLNAHKDKAFSKFQFLFKAINGNFVPVSEDDLKMTREITALNIKYNWEADDAKIAALNKN